MKTITTALLLALLCLGLTSAARAQEQPDPAELLRDAGDWLTENIDDSVFDTLGVDQFRVRQFLHDLHRSFQGNYVYDLAALRDTAIQLQPILERYEETQPYAAWLNAHLVDFDVSQKLRDQISATVTNKLHLPPPSPQLQRTVWVRAIDSKPAPPAATSQLARLKQIFAEEKMPRELVWLAEVESSFDPRAQSPAGAAGLFQLMPATARSLDLDVGLFSDERLHPEKNGRAAARYLRELHQRFGDWRLALAAYNCGPTRVADLLKKHRAKTYDAISPYLPVETQMYVPKVEATLRKREGVTLTALKRSAG
jgi:membrane-bound lytic murein transglycosylase D